MSTNIKYDNSLVTIDKAVLFALIGSAVREHNAKGQFTTVDYYEAITNTEAINIAIDTLGNGWFINGSQLDNNHNSPTATSQRVKAAIHDNVPITDQNLRRDIMKLVDLIEKEDSNG